MSPEFRKEDLKKSTKNMGMSSWSENLKDRDEQDMDAKKKKTVYLKNMLFVIHYHKGG